MVADVRAAILPEPVQAFVSAGRSEGRLDLAVAARRLAHAVGRPGDLVAALARGVIIQRAKMECGPDFQSGRERPDWKSGPLKQRPRWLDWENAMSIIGLLSSFALRQVAGDVEGGSFSQLLGDRFSDGSQRLLSAVRRANENAWKALEISLAGESLWRCLDRPEDRAFRAQIRTFLDNMPL